jgi:hypothetical protein
MNAIPGNPSLQRSDIMDSQYRTYGAGKICCPLFLPGYRSGAEQEIVSLVIIDNQLFISLA